MSTSLLQSCSYQTEKYFKRRGGRFEVVLYVTLDKNGRREWFERDCFSAPKEPSDEEILKGLAWELQGDFKAAGVISFAIAYLANHVREMKVIATGEVTRTATKVVVVEEHGLDGGTRGYREIMSLLGSKPILGALTIAGSAADSVYAWVLAADEIAIAAE